MNNIQCKSGALSRVLFVVILALFGSVLCIHNAAHAQQPAAPAAIQGEIPEHGIYKARLNPKTGQATGVALIKKTYKVPALEGSIFGIQVRLSGVPQGERETVVIRVNHPPMPDTETGQTVTWYDVPVSLADGELRRQLQVLPMGVAPTPGAYVFQVLHNGKSIAKREFDVYDVNTAPPTPTPLPAATPTPTATPKPSPSASFMGEHHTACRNYSPAILEKNYPGFWVIGQQSFHLKLPEYGDACFLTLSDGLNTAFALYGAKDRFAHFAPKSTEGAVLAVGFEDFNGDQAPEISVIMLTRGKYPNRVFWSKRAQGGIDWAPDAAVDEAVGGLPSYKQVRKAIKQRLQSN